MHGPAGGPILNPVRQVLCPVLAGRDGSGLVRPPRAHAGRVTSMTMPPGTTVAFGGYAATGFWLMTRYGHADVPSLDCSRNTRRAEGPVEPSGVTGLRRPPRP
jgi:hypothetical protein